VVKRGYDEPDAFTGHVRICGRQFVKIRETLEWLSLAPADIPCWFAAGALVGMRIAGSLFLAIIFAVAAVLLSLTACYFGMPPRDEFGETTNAAKRTMYPLFVVVVVIAVGVIFAIRS
jgi:hypothetical protein